MQQETETQASGLQDSGPEPITLKDVLHAVFMPPSEAPHGPLTEVIPPQMLKHARLEIADDPAPDILTSTEPLATVYEHEPVRDVSTAGTSRIMLLGFGVVAAVLLSYLAQVALASGENPGTAQILYFLAAVTWFALLALEFAPPDGGLLRRGPRAVPSGASHDEAWLTRSSLLTRSLLSVMALSLSGATYIFTADNTFTLPGVLTWIGSIIGWLLVVAKREPETLIGDFASHLTNLRLPEWGKLFNRRTALVIVLSLAIIGAAIFFRFYRIAEIPGEMTSDHVEKLLDAYDVSQGQYHVYFPRNGGREAIQMYLVAIASRLFGTGMSFLTLKLVSALEALALVPLVIWLGRELVDWETGLLAAALLAISWWDASLARLGLRIVLTPLVFTCVLIATLRGIRTRSRTSWIWVGIWLGIGVYSYQAMRMAPLVVVAGFLIAVTGPVIRAVRSASADDSSNAVRRIIATNIVGTQAVNLTAAAVVALAIFVPMLRFWHDDSAALWNRVVNRTTSSEVAIQGSPFDVLVSNYRDALGMYNVRGDSAWIDSVPGAPTLDLVTGALLILGVVAWLMRLRVRRDAGDVFVLVAGLIMLLPSALAIAFPIENPSVTRASGTLPVVMVLAAWPLVLTRQRWSAVMGARSGTLLASGMIAVLIAGAAVLNYQTFFEKFPASYRLSALNPGEVAREVRKVIGSDGSLAGVWLVGWPYWHDYRAIGIEAGDITFENAILDSNQLQLDLQSTPNQFDARPLVFIIAEEDTSSRELLEAHFPQGSLEHHVGISEKHNFYLFVVNQ